MATSKTKKTGKNKAFERQVAGLTNKGYKLMDIIVSDITDESGNSVISKSNVPEFKAMCECAPATLFNNNQTSVGTIANAAKDRAVTKAEKVDSFEYIQWGRQDNIPQQVIQLTDSNPFTSAAQDWLIGTMEGLGPKLMYHDVRITANGDVEDVVFPYEHAGKYLRAKLKAAKAPAVDVEVDSDEVAELEAQLQQWQDSWYGTERPGFRDKVGGIKDFLDVNDISDLYGRWVSDFQYLDICFPTVGLSTGLHFKEGSREIIPWDPFIARLSYLPAVCARYEKRDANLNINHVLHSERWRDYNNSTAEQTELSNACVPYPTLFPKNFLPKLRKMVKDAATSGYNQRPYWFCAPISMADPLDNPYPTPKWWSVFKSQFYQYSMTLIGDKFAARQNATMWGKMIFFNSLYLEAYCASQGLDSPEEKQQARTDLFKKINDFLKKRENTGKTIALDSIPSPDGKSMIDAIKIVDVPPVSTAGDLKSELEEITSVIFFGMGVNPGVVGCIPGKTSSNSGTYQRELTLLKQNQMTPRQRKFLRLLQNIFTFNRWDEHAEWVIAQKVLTTLDRNPEGVEDTIIH